MIVARIAAVLAAAGFLITPAAGADPAPVCGQTSQPCPPPVGSGFYLTPGGADHPAPPPPADRRTPGSQAAKR